MLSLFGVVFIKTNTFLTVTNIMSGSAVINLGIVMFNIYMSAGFDQATVNIIIN